MDKQELNSAIALYFGFKRSEGSEYLCNGLPQWTYPNGWHLAQGGVPNCFLPDFVQMLEDYLEFRAKHEYGGPREYFGYFDRPQTGGISGHE